LEEEKRKNKETSMINLEEIIQELKEKKLIECEKINQLEKVNFEMSLSNFTDEEKSKLAESVFENIKKNKEGWKIIKKVLTIDYGSCSSYNALLIHDSAQLKYNGEILVYNRNKMWEKKFFSLQQQKELEKFLPIEESFQGQNETKFKKYAKYSLYGLIILVILSLIFLAVKRFLKK
jgi:hypothetical protein